MRYNITNLYGFSKKAYITHINEEAIPCFRYENGINFILIQVLFFKKIILNNKNKYEVHNFKIEIVE